MRKTGIACCVAILMLAAALAAPAALAADASGMAATVVAWEKAYNADDLKALAAFYAANAYRNPPNATRTAEGHEAIMAAVKAGKDQGAAKVKLTLTKAETSGDLGYGTGTYELTSADGKQIDKGKWVNVSKKSKGKWHVQFDIWNSDLPAPAATAK